MKVVFGLILSGVWINYGLWLGENTSPILAVGPLSVGIYTLMALSADTMAPRASRVLTWTLKLATAEVFFVWAGLMYLSAARGSPM